MNKNCPRRVITRTSGQDGYFDSRDVQEEKQEDKKRIHKKRKINWKRQKKRTKQREKEKRRMGWQGESKHKVGGIQDRSHSDKEAER